MGFNELWLISRCTLFDFMACDLARKDQAWVEGMDKSIGIFGSATEKPAQLCYFRCIFAFSLSHPPIPIISYTIYLETCLLLLFMSCLMYECIILFEISLYQYITCENCIIHIVSSATFKLIEYAGTTTYFFIFPNIYSH